MISMSRSVLLAVGLLTLPPAGASAQPPAGDTLSKTTPSRPGEAAAGPTGPSAIPTTTKSTGEKVDSGATTGKKVDPGSSTGPSGKQPQ
jgi:hypothetical protein